MAATPTIIYWPEKVAVYSGAWTPDTGTVTIVSVAVTLYDAQWAVAGSISALIATGFDAGAQSSPSAWFDVDPIARALSQPTMATGQEVYTLRFIGTDSAGKRYVSDVPIVLKP